MRVQLLERLQGLALREYLGKDGTMRLNILLVTASVSGYLGQPANASHLVGVMLRGRWLPNAELRRLLDEVAAARQRQ